MQSYDPSTGEYGCRSCGYTRIYETAEKRYKDLSKGKALPNTSKGMPNYKKAITPEEKFTKYSLDMNSIAGRHKAIVYKSVLGFTIDNCEELIRQIHESITSGNARLIKITKNEKEVIKYEYLIKVKGVNGNIADVVAVYGIDKNKAKPRMITNYVK